MTDRFAYKELVFDGRVAKAHRVGVRMPDGRVVERDWIHYGGAAVILPILDDGSVVLIRNYRFAVDETLYELPAGMMDPADASPEQCARRELAEETGYTAGRIELLGSFYSGPGTCDERMHAFVATGLSAGEQDLEVYERIEAEIVAEAEVRAMVADGRIHDAKTIATLGLYWLKASRAGPGEGDPAQDAPSPGR
ncbi:MAG TPA: NUDIX hydrolase [Phycisphaerae bacterium]|nr:NUDIX hydrolase [Phycisphaerae bacterium]